MGSPKVHSLMKTWQRIGSNGAARVVGLDLVIARDDPDPPCVFQTYLSRTQNMAGRVE